MGKCSEYVEKMYGFPCKSRVSVVVLAAGITARTLANHPDRVGWVEYNLGAAVGWVAPDSLVGPLYGIQLNAAGDFATASVKDDGEFPSMEQYGFSTVGTTLFIIEIIGR